MKATRTLETALPGHLDHGKIMKLLGYNLAQATIPTDKVFEQHIRTVFQLNKVDFTVLMLLSSNDDVTPMRLSKALNFPASNITIILDRLEERKLLERTRSESDRRVQQVRLTRAGLAMARKLEAASDAMENDLLVHLTDAERAMLFELLKKVAVHRRV